MIFLRDKIEQELRWAFRCKGCGEMYVIRPILEVEVPVFGKLKLLAYKS